MKKRNEQPVVDKEIGAEFDIGENKSIGFMYKPEEKKAQLGFKMSFDEGMARDTFVKSF